MRLTIRLLTAACALLLTAVGIAAVPAGTSSAGLLRPTAAAAQTGAAGGTGTAAGGADAAAWTPSFPIRAAFYYPWFPETWGPATDRYTHYHPSLGWYDSGAADVIAAHVDGMLYAGLHVGIASWWGPGTRTDAKLPALLAGAAGKPFRWAAYVEEEGSGDPTSDTISSRLTYLQDHYANDPSYLRLDGKPVVFVYADPGDGCGMAQRWTTANAGRFFVVLKDFPGYTQCASQPDDWHQYAPANDVQTSTGSFTVSPGFWHAREATPRLARDPDRFAADVARMAASGKRWQLVTTWNEWGEGTAVEPAQEWATTSGYGRYADIMHAALATDTGTSPSPAPVRTVVPAEADATVTAAEPRRRLGTLPRLWVDGSPRMRSYLRFRVPAQPGRLVSATLVADVPRGASGSTRVFTTSPRWREGRISQATAPALGPSVGSSGPVPAGGRLRLDVTSALQQAGSHAFALTTRSAGGHWLPSREGGTGGPRLLLDYDTQAGTGTTIAAAGDIACATSSGSYNGGAGTASSCRQSAVADLVAARGPAAVLPLGDTQYDCGELDQFQTAYDGSWGRLLPITHPAVGNHEYGKGCSTARPNSAAGYFTYFGSSAGPDRHGWYSYDLAGWHLVALNSECSSGTDDVPVGGCSESSPQYQWLAADLAAHPAACTLAYWHEPRWTSGEHTNATGMNDIWNLLVSHGADVVLAGHNHSYERFDPLGPATATGDPVPDPNGVREFVVGTGGKNHYAFARAPLTGEVVRNGDTFGALFLTLGSGSYSWEFVPEPGKTFTDSGSGTCH